MALQIGRAAAAMTRRDDREYLERSVREEQRGQRVRPAPRCIVVVFQQTPSLACGRSQRCWRGVAARPGALASTNAAEWAAEFVATVNDKYETEKRKAESGKRKAGKEADLRFDRAESPSCDSPGSSPGARVPKKFSSGL